MRWMKGPPPGPGWYIASARRKVGTYRWWNGYCWSEAAHIGDTMAQVVHAASRRCTQFVSEQIEWIKP